MKRYALLLMLAASIVFSGRAEILRVLAIGNSYSANSVEQNLYELALSQGDTLLLANAYISGCDLDRHFSNLVSDNPAYGYRRVESGVRSETKNVTLRHIITDEPWDIITLQQSSKLSGDSGSFGNLAALKDSVAALAVKPDVDFVWHHTWAYAADYTSPNFSRYGFSQDAMHDSIVNVVNTVVAPHRFVGIIPTGVAVRIARARFESQLSDDGTHLSPSLGVYLAACVWCEYLLGRPVTDSQWHPQSISPEDAAIAREAAHDAFTL